MQVSKIDSQCRYRNPMIQPFAIRHAPPTPFVVPGRLAGQLHNAVTAPTMDAPQ
jgi:hypothetical protein